MLTSPLLYNPFTSLSAFSSRTEAETICAQGEGENYTTVEYVAACALLTGYLPAHEI